MDIKQAAAKWGVTPMRVRQLILEGRIPSARYDYMRHPGQWVIPDDEPEPVRRRYQYKGRE
jgi:hypothetical protein